MVINRSALASALSAAGNKGLHISICGLKAGIHKHLMQIILVAERHGPRPGVVVPVWRWHLSDEKRTHFFKAPNKQNPALHRD